MKAGQKQNNQSSIHLTKNSTRHAPDRLQKVMMLMISVLSTRQSIRVICVKMVYKLRSSVALPSSQLRSILYKSIAGRYQPISYPEGQITARYRFIFWVFCLCVCNFLCGICGVLICFSPLLPLALWESRALRLWHSMDIFIDIWNSYDKKIPTAERDVIQSGGSF